MQSGLKPRNPVEAATPPPTALTSCNYVAFFNVAPPGVQEGGLESGFQN